MLQGHAPGRLGENGVEGLLGAIPKCVELADLRDHAGQLKAHTAYVSGLLADVPTEQLGGWIGKAGPQQRLSETAGGIERAA